LLCGRNYELAGQARSRWNNELERQAGGWDCLNTKNNKLDYASYTYVAANNGKKEGSFIGGIFYWTRKGQLLRIKHWGVGGYHTPIDFSFGQ